MRSKMSGWKSLAIGSAAMAVFSVGLCIAADDTTPKMTVKEVMEKAHKAPQGSPPNSQDFLAAKVRDGKASKEEVTTLLGYYKAMAADPVPEGAPRGTPEDWKKRTSALVTAVETIDKGDKTAGQAALKTAMDCRGCHMSYRKPPARRGA